MCAGPSDAVEAELPGAVGPAVDTGETAGVAVQPSRNSANTAALTQRDTVLTSGVRRLVRGRAIVHVRLPQSAVNAVVPNAPPPRRRGGLVASRLEEAPAPGARRSAWDHRFRDGADRRHRLREDSDVDAGGRVGTGEDKRDALGVTAGHELPV